MVHVAAMANGEEEGAATGHSERRASPATVLEAATRAAWDGAKSAKRSWEDAAVVDRKRQRLHATAN